MISNINEITTFYFKKEGLSSLSCLERLDGLYYLKGERYVIDEVTNSYTRLPTHERDGTTCRIVLIALSCLTGVGLILYAAVLIRRCYCHYQLRSLQDSAIPTQQIPPIAQPPQEVVQTTEDTDAIASKQIQEETAQIKQRIKCYQNLEAVEAQNEKQALEQAQALQAQVKKDKEEREAHALNFAGSTPLINPKEISPNAASSFLKGFKLYNPEKHTFQFKGKECPLLTPSTTDFSQTVFFIAAATQPICYMDPQNSPQLLALAERLKQELVAKGKEDPVAKLEYIKAFVSAQAFPKPEKVTPIPPKTGPVLGVDDCIFQQSNQHITRLPLISIESYLEYPGNENSLHRALVTAFLLDVLVKHKIVSEGIPLVMFAVIKNKQGKHAHFWNQFLVPSKNERWHIDTHHFLHQNQLLSIPVSNLSIRSTEMQLKDCYSPDAIDTQMQAADSLLEYLQNSDGSTSLPAYVELCSRKGGVFISKTASGVPGINSGPRYHAIWQLVLNRKLQFAFYKSSRGDNDYSCIKYINNQFLLKTFTCSNLQEWDTALEEVCALVELNTSATPPKDWKRIKDGEVFSMLSYSYFDGRPHKAVTQGPDSGSKPWTDQEMIAKWPRIVISNGKPDTFDSVLYKQDAGYVHKTIQKAEIRDLRLFIQEVAAITGTPYVDAPAVYRKVQKSQRQKSLERPSIPLSPFFATSIDREWDACYESDRGFVHEWPGFAKIFTSKNSDFQIQGDRDKFNKYSSTDIIQLLLTFSYKPQYFKSVPQHQISFYLTFKNIKDPAVQGFLRYMAEEYGVTSLSYYKHCLRTGEALSKINMDRYGSQFTNLTGSGKSLISAYLKPFVHRQNKEIASTPFLFNKQARKQARIAGFAFPKSLEAIIYKEVLAFFENSHLAVLESECHLSKVTVDIITEYIGIEGITKAKLTLTEEEDPKNIDEAFLKVGLKEMISLGRVKVTENDVRGRVDR